MKITMNDNWLGKMLNYPTNICVFGWGLLWRLGAVMGVSGGIVCFVWLWCLAFRDAFLVAHPQAPIAFLALVLMTGMAIWVTWLTHEMWWYNDGIVAIRRRLKEMCPTIEWNRGESE